MPNKFANTPDPVAVTDTKTRVVWTPDIDDLPAGSKVEVRITPFGESVIAKSFTIPPNKTLRNINLSIEATVT